MQNCLTLKWTVKNVPRKFALPSVNWLHLSLKVFFHARIETCMFLGKMFKVYIFWCHPHEKTLFFFFSFFHFFLVARTQRSQRRRQRKKKKAIFCCFFCFCSSRFLFFSNFLTQSKFRDFRQKNTKYWAKTCFFRVLFFLHVPILRWKRRSFFWCISQVKLVLYYFVFSSSFSLGIKMKNIYVCWFNCMN